MTCPCGTECEIVEHVRQEGVMDGHGRAQRIVAVFHRALYFSDAGNRDFCSAFCSLKWEELFWRPFQRHLGKLA